MTTLSSRIELADFFAETADPALLESADRGHTELLDYRQLYELWERQQWLTQELDFSQDREDWHGFPADERFQRMYGLSSFFIGEQKVTDELGPMMRAAPTEDMRVFLSTQIADEARHVRFFDRFYAEVGVLEADDLQRWAAWVQARRPGTCLYGLGTSLGAAEILMAEGRRHAFCAIVSDASYATFLDAGLDRVARVLMLGDAGRWIGRPAAYVGLASVRLLHGVNLLAANPVEAIARAQAPILLIHGDADRNSPVYHTRALAAAQPKAEVWIVPGATHGGCWRAEPQAYPARIVAFFATHGRPGANPERPGPPAGKIGG